jgi:hypothetical protein
LLPNTWQIILILKTEALAGGLGAENGSFVRYAFADIDVT